MHTVHVPGTENVFFLFFLAMGGWGLLQCRYRRVKEGSSERAVAVAVEGGRGFNVACQRANSCAGVGAPPWLRYSDLGWAAMWARRYSAADSSPAYSGPVRSLGMALKKEIKFPLESKAP